MPKSGFAVVIAGWLALVIEDEVRVRMRETANWLDEAAVVPLGAGGKVGCEKDLVRSVDVLVRDNKRKILGSTRWSVSQAWLDYAETGLT
jgi:hypothetical protein